MTLKSNLPIDKFIKEIVSDLAKFDNLIIVAAPGAGKTTRVPPALLDITSKKILMLQPRRIATRASAERIAEEQQWKLGKEVGYRVRFEDCTSPQTRLVIVTEALLMRELLHDPDLSEYGIVILDEFHERNLYSDAGLAALRELQQLNRPDLKIIVMSATIDSKPLANYLQPAATINVPGQTFSIEVHYDLQSQLLNTDRNFIERVSSKIFEALTVTEDDKHILVFLPGLSEIQRVEEILVTNPRLPKQRRVMRLFGSLSLDEQHAVLHTNVAKIILATNVAETSLTIDGVSTVVDSGLARELQFDQRRLFPWLKTTRISRASAEQRKGRAGRQYPGHCFRLWTKLDDQSMQPFSAPDIATQDLSELTLLLCQLGVTDVQTFSWFETPPTQNLVRAQTFLLNLKLISNDNGLNRLTEKGHWVQRLPVGPRLGALVFEGVRLHAPVLAAQIASILNERDPWGRDSLDSWLSACHDSDLYVRLAVLNQAPIPREFQLVEKLARQLCRNLSVNYHPLKDLPLQTVTQILLEGFSDRLARRRRPQERAALVVGLKGVELSTRSLVRQSEFFLCLSGHANESNGNAIVDLAHPITKTMILDSFPAQITLNKEAKYFSEKDTWMSVEQKMFRDLPIEEPNLKPLILNSETLVPIAKVAFQNWKTAVPKLQQWHQRMQLAQQLWPSKQWPELSHWENDAIEMACLGENSLQAVREKDWNEIFCYSLAQTEKNFLNVELPESITSPRGKSLNLIYEAGGTVSLELKIQEAYGWRETPKIAQGRIKIRLVLLGPHLRPLQTTDDLSSFWKGTYQELRPSLKARYPKHQWPADPSTI
jgi:ATP-dependent helicase HrpB